MKKLFKISFAIVALSMIFISCKKDEAAIPDFYNQTINFVEAESNYLGNYYGVNSNVFDLYLYNNPENKTSYTGNDVYFDVNSPLYAKTLASGTYTAGGGNEFTFQKGELKLDQNGNYYTSGSYVKMWENGKITGYKAISEGSVALTANANGNYTVKGTVKTLDNVNYKLNYSGFIPLKDLTPKPNTLTKGMVKYEETIIYNNTSLKIYSIKLGASGVNLTDFSGSGDAMQMEVYIPSYVAVTNALPDGEYPVSDNPAPYTTSYGYIDNKNNNRYGTWYYTNEALKINTGKLIITSGGKSFDYNFKTEFGMPITGTFTGALSISNAPAIHRMKSFNIEQSLESRFPYNERIYRVRR